jgi:hypothetical protein
MISPQTAERRKLRTAGRWPRFAPARGLGNAHLQTWFGTLFRAPPALPYRAETWSTPDDDFLVVHVAEAGAPGPVAILLHGLEGSAQSPYVVGLGQRLRTLGYTVLAMEQRSCSGQINRARRLYHSGVTDDLDFVIRRVHERWPDRPLFVGGVSLGGNQLGRWLGTHHPPDAVRAAAIVSAPFDLTVSGPHLDRRGAGYVRFFLRTLVPKALEKERQYPGCIDPVKVRQSRNFDDFDTHATAALHGFVDATDYYRKVSCGQYLGDARVPTLLLAAADDPFNPGVTLPRRVADASPYLVPCFTARGGHVGFVAGTPLRPHFWMDDVITGFFEAHRAFED